MDNTFYHILPNGIKLIHKEKKEIWENQIKEI